MPAKAKIWAVVPSAGSGQRMQQSIPKQYLELRGKAVLEHTLAVLLAEQNIRQVVVSVAADDAYWSRLDYAKDPKVISTTGGKTRALSVLNGISSLSAQARNDDWVLVHDAARPCLSTDLLRSFIEQLRDARVGGILALASKDTVKLTPRRGATKIEQTLDRDRIWYAQTPQMFRYGLLKEALEQAIDNGEAITDEASAMELAGYQPRLIAGEARNLKITTPDDLELADFFIR